MDRYRVALPPVDPEGTVTIRSFGRFVDNLLGDARRERVVRRRRATLHNPPADAH